MRTFLCTAVLLMLAPGCFPQAVSAERQVARAKRNDDPFLQGAPLTFEQLLKLAGQDAIPLHRRKDAIQSRGLGFSPSSADIDKLKAAGIPDELLKLIKGKAKPEAAALPPAPKPQPLGGLAVTCAPAECEINLNGTTLGPTKDGRIEMAKLRPGKWVLDFKKKGYVGQQTAAVIDGDRTVPVSVVLEPDHATQEAFGTELFHKMVQAIGGADGLKELASVQAAGSITIGNKDGKSVRWTLLVRNKPDRALFQIKAGGIFREVAFTGTEYKTSRNLKGQDALEMPTGFGLIRDNQLSALIAKLENPEFKMVASHNLPVDGEEFTLFAESGTEKISIGLDNELRPQRVRITTSAGVGSVVVAYSDYFKKEKASYPKTMQIKPDGWQQGIDVHFDTVGLNPNLTDNDFKLKGKALPNLGN